MFFLWDQMKCKMHVWLFDNRVYLFRLDFDWQNGLVYLCLRYYECKILEWHPVQELFVHVNKPSILFFGIIIFVVLGIVYIHIHFSHDINMIILLQIIDQKMLICNTSFTIFVRKYWPLFLCYCACNAIMKHNTSQRNNYFPFAITSLINRSNIYA